MLSLFLKGEIIMIKEKSCGAVVYKIINNQYYFLIEKMKRGHFSIPKGHVEKGETDVGTVQNSISRGRS